MEKIKARLINELFDATVDVAEYLSSIDENGAFSDIDYKSDKRDIWHPIEHLQRTLKLQQAYHTPNNKNYKNHKLQKAILKSMQFWAVENFNCTWNWWWNSIGIGLYLPDILLLGVDGLSGEYREKLIRSVKCSSLKKESVKLGVKERKVQSTGGNFTDKMITELKLAVVENDSKYITYLKNLIENELRVFPMHKRFMNKADTEGIKSDMSFHQHFQLVYFEGYGTAFCSGINTYLKCTYDTAYELSESALNFYCDFILDGAQYVVRNGYSDINASGRGIVRENVLKDLMPQIISACEILLKYKAVNRQSELHALLINRIPGNDKGGSGYKYFWNSDYGVYNGKRYMASVRHAGKNTRIYEYINGENPYGYYTGFGASFLYVSGDEYYNLFPLIDWNYISGTTTRQGYLPTFKEERLYYKTGNTIYVSGVGNGKAGLSYFRLKSNGLKAKKAYFMFEKGVVFLGTDIQSSRKGNIITTINQTHLSDQVIVSENDEIKILENNESQCRNFDYIYHNKIGYFSNVPISVSVERKTEDWQKINERSDSKIIEDNIVCLNLNHGEKLKNASYCYTMLMDANITEVQKYYKNPKLIVLKNCSDVQAVWDSENEIVQAVFHKKSQLNLPDGNLLKVSDGCVMTVERLNGGYCFCLAAHNGKSKIIKIAINQIGQTIKISNEPVYLKII